jgi:hypothetical protein
MDIQPNDPKTWLSATVSALSVILGWLWVRIIRQHDAHGARIQKLERTTITRAELAEYMSLTREERRQMHDENTETLRRIHERVDQLWERL